jgi:tetratricopeptide (TPR) repeat protein
MKTALTLFFALIVSSQLSSYAQSSVTGSFPLTSSSDEAVEKFKEGSQKYLNLQYIDSEALLEEAIALDPDFAVALATKAWTTYSKDTLRARKLMAHANQQYAALSYAEQTYIEGINALMYKRDEVPYFEILVERYPDCEFFNSALANIYFKKGQGDKMQHILSAMLERNANASWAHNMMGYFHMNRDDHRLARKAFGQYLLLAPELANPHDSMGDYYMKMKKYDKAKAHYDQAFAIDPVNFQFSQVKAIEADQATAANR